MKNLPTEKNNFNRFKNTKRKAISVSTSELTTIEYPEYDGHIFPVIKPQLETLNLPLWATNNQQFIDRHLLQQGYILFRGFKMAGVEEFEYFMKSVFGDLLEYSYASTPRSKVNGKIYTSTEYPAEQSIPLHNEMSYSRNWPMKISFYCLQPAQKEGFTPIADSRKIFQRINPKIREKFQEKKVMYVRNYGDKLDLPWQNVFQTTNKSQVEDYCRRAGIDFEWTNKNGLTTRQVCQAVAKHPQTSEMVWFNQAHLFHISNLDDEVRENLLAIYEEDKLPRNAYYGDGTNIEVSVLDEIRAIYQQEAFCFPWQKGDLLLLENMLISHGRTTFVGPRKVVVAMSISS